MSASAVPRSDGEVSEVANLGPADADTPQEPSEAGPNANPHRDQNTH